MLVEAGGATNIGALGSISCATIPREGAKGILLVLSLQGKKGNGGGSFFSNLEFGPRLIEGGCDYAVDTEESSERTPTPWSLDGRRRRPF